MLLYVVALVVLAWPVAAQGQSGNVDRVLAEMHAAMGGADAVAAVRTFRATGTQQRVTPRGTTDKPIGRIKAPPTRDRRPTVRLLLAAPSGRRVSNAAVGIR